MPLTFDPEVDYAPAPSPPTSAAHMGPSWNAVWRIAITNADKVVALAEAKGMIKEKLRWERAVAAEKRERMKVGVSAWKLARELDEWKTQPPLQSPQQLQRTIPHDISKPSASEVVKRTYAAIWERPRSNRYAVTKRDEDLAYRAIKVKYVGSIDPEVDTVPDKRPAASVVSFFIPIFDARLHKLKNPTWTLKNAHEIALSLSETVALFPTHALYLLTHPLLLMFTRLFFLADEIAEKLDTVGIEVGDDWHERTRDEFLWTYCGDWEKRPIDCVERTYMATRDEVRWYVENDVDEDGSAIVAASVDGNDGEGSDGQDGENEQAGDDEDVELED